MTDKENLYNELQEEYKILERAHEKDEKILVTKTKQIYALVKENKNLAREASASKRKLEVSMSQDSLDASSGDRMIFEERTDMINQPEIH